jgi:hypothetical protein
MNLAETPHGHGIPGDLASSACDQLVTLASTVQLRGLLHLAGRLQDALLGKMTRQDFEAVKFRCVMLSYTDPPSMISPIQVVRAYDFGTCTIFFVGTWRVQDDILYLYLNSSR